MRMITALVVLMTLTGCRHYPSAQTSFTPEQSLYLLSANDVVTVHVFNEPDLSNDYTIDGQGKITLPLIGKIAVGSLSEQQAAQKIATALKEGGYLQNPRITVALKDARPVFVMGEVEKAGEYAFKHGLTVYQAVALAGGYTYRADRNDILISRLSGKGTGNETRLSASENTPILPGDVIEVGERFF